MANVTVMVVSLTTVKLLTVMPVPAVTLVAPVKSTPVRVTLLIVWPRRPTLGLTDVSAGAFTVKVTALVVPMGVVTVTFRAVVPAPDEMTKFAVTVVALVLVMVAVTPVPDTVTAVAPVKLLPVRVTATVLPRYPEVGLMEVSVGPCTVNIKELLVPLGVVTLTVLAPVAAVVVMTNVAVI
jgi:hypothetical protein